MTKMYLPGRGEAIQALLQCLLCLGVVVGFSSFHLYAQGTEATIQGTITDSSGAVVPGASITVTNIETNLQRTVSTNSAGLYVVSNLPPGRYRVQVSAAGFQTNLRENLDLVVGQQMVLNTPLQVGEITQQVTVTGEAPIVNTSVAQVSGLVGERQVKDLPLNGRSFDNLITLNPGAVNTTALKTAGASSSSGPGNYFAVAGRRPGENTFLWNGVEYPGGSGAESGTPGGVSGQLLGIDAVREFNVMSNIDSAEYGHHGGAQISVITASGSNSFHGSAFEFLRNSDLDARNFFDHAGVPPFKRNQFGGSAGGPIRKDKTFIFGNYEGFRQRLGLSDVAVVPDQLARTGQLPNAQGVYQPVAGFNPAVVPYLALWPAPNQELFVNGLPTGTALSYSNPASPIREDFGIVRVDNNLSDRDSLSGAYTIDDGENITTPNSNPFSLLTATLRTQILSLTETHIFSANVVNTVTAGYSRPNLHIDSPDAITQAGAPPLVVGLPLNEMAQLKIGGGSTSGSSITIAGSQATGSTQGEVLNNFTYEDQVHVTKGIHSLTLGGWSERLRWDELNFTNGQVLFPSLASFLQGQPSSLAVQINASAIPWRSWMGAWYVQDSMKLRPNLTLSVGVRHEFTNGFNNHYKNAGNYIPDSNGVLQTQPVIGVSPFLKNRAHWLFGPRLGLAWDPFGDGKTSIRAGFGIAHSLLDNIGWCCKSTNPAFANYQVNNPPFPFQVNPSTGFAPGLNVVVGSTGGGGVQPDPYTPTVINYRLEIERELTPAMSLRVAYIGSHGYHEVFRADGNLAVPVICSTAQGNCPAGLPDGTKYFPPGDPRRNPRLGSFTQMYTSAFNRYNGLAVDLNRRFRSGLAFRANYTYAKSLDNSSSITSGQASGNNPILMDPYDRARDYGLSTFDVRSRFSFSSSYELPFGSGKALFSGSKGVEEKLIGGWQINLIVGLQSGFPITPQLGFNQSRDGNTSTPDRPNMAPGRTLSGVYIHKQTRWYDPTTFALPVAGTYGNVGRNVLIGPGLESFDLSLFKTTHLSERFNLQFRAEFFNLFNRANFGVPNTIALTTSGAPAPSAGFITRTTTTSRQIQFGMKLNW